MADDLTRLHRFIVENFSLDELRTLCFDLKVNYDDLAGEALSGKARELIFRLERKHRLDDLLAHLQEARPEAFAMANLDIASAKPPSIVPERKIEHRRRNVAQSPGRRPPVWMWIFGGVLALILVGGMFLEMQFGLLSRVSPTDTHAPLPAATSVEMPPIATTLTATLMLAATSTPTVTPTPTPEPGTTRVREKDGAVMVYVPAGKFLMGSEEDPNAQEVSLKAFWIDRTEVTNTQYGQCVDAHACTQTPLKDCQSLTYDNYYDDPRFDDYPVVCVTWHQAREYAKWVGGRLPTEAEWEYATRGPGGFIYPWGNSPPNDSLLNYNGNVGDATKVGSYPEGKSWCGALDMAGNVWEWTQSLYDRYPYDPTDGRENLGTEGTRVIRGGAFDLGWRTARCTFRSWHNPRDSWNHLGFRVVTASR
jgi:formylglycine-generating enzyme required for sulfatase activity